MPGNTVETRFKDTSVVVDRLVPGVNYTVVATVFSNSLESQRADAYVSTSELRNNFKFVASFSERLRRKNLKLVFKLPITRRQSLM